VGFKLIPTVLKKRFTQKYRNLVTGRFEFGGHLSFTAVVTETLPAWSSIAAM
jgi:hypothetical protein